MINPKCKEHGSESAYRKMWEKKVKGYVSIAKCTCPDIKMEIGLSDREKKDQYIKQTIEILKCSHEQAEDLYRLALDLLGFEENELIKKQNFFDAVREDQEMSDDQKEYWLSKEEKAE